MMISSFIITILIKSHLFSCQRHILVVDIDKINLDNDKNFDEDDPDTIIHLRLLAWHSKSKKNKALKKR